MSNSLYVLNTRPQPACWQLQQALDNASIKSICQPLLEYQANSSSKVLKSLVNEVKPNIVIFISQAAVDFTNNTWPLHDWLTPETTLIAVGNKTRDALNTLGLQAICPKRHDSEGMLALSPLSSPYISNSNVLIIRGNGGREHLATTLNARGANVHYFESYQRNWLNIPAEQDKVWKNKQINAMVITSESQLIRMVELLSPVNDYWANKCTFVVPSKRIAETGHSLGLRNILISDGANDSAIVKTLKGME